MKKIIFAGVTAVIFSCAMGAANAYTYNKEEAAAACTCRDCTCEACTCSGCQGDSCNCDAACCADKHCGQGCCK